MYCTNCGSAQSDTARFCGRCGSQMDNQGWQAPTAQSPPTAATPQVPIEYPPPAAYQQPLQPAFTPPQPAGLGYTQPPQAPSAPDRVSSPVLRHHRLIAAAAVLVVGGLAVAGWRVHWPPALFGSTAPPALTWSSAQAPLPANATRTSKQYSALNDVACPSAGSCVAVGLYDSGDSANTGNGLIETLSDGIWTPATAPSNVPGASQVSFLNLDGVACPSMASCVAVGGYWDHQGIQRPLIETHSGSRWVPARGALPGDGDQSKPAFISEVACPAPGSCVATGWYTDSNGDIQGLIETLSTGSWSASTAPLPGDAQPRPLPSQGLPPTDLVVVRCAAMGDCVATGNYTDSKGGMQPLIETLSQGNWTAGKATLPSDAAAPNPNAFLWAIACQAPGSCVAGGHYNTRGGQSRDLVATQSGGTWTPAVAPLPADAAASQKWSANQLTGLTAAACQAVGTCMEAGTYIAGNGALEGVIVWLSGGAWTSARAPLPAGAAGADQFAFFDSAACPTTGACFAVGGYKAADGSTEPMLETGAPRHG